MASCNAWEKGFAQKEAAHLLIGFSKPIPIEL